MSPSPSTNHFYTLLRFQPFPWSITSSAPNNIIVFKHENPSRFEVSKSPVIYHSWHLTWSSPYESKILLVIYSSYWVLGVSLVQVFILTENYFGTRADTYRHIIQFPFYQRNTSSSSLNHTEKFCSQVGRKKEESLPK